MGDMHGAALVRALMEAAAEAQVEVEICGVGGKRMRDAGAHLIGGWCVTPLPPPLHPLILALTRICGISSSQNSAHIMTCYRTLLHTTTPHECKSKFTGIKLADTI